MRYRRCPSLSSVLDIPLPNLFSYRVTRMAREYASNFIETTETSSPKTYPDQAERKKGIF
jgi:hypothetical protein